MKKNRKTIAKLFVFYATPKKTITRCTQTQ